MESECLSQLHAVSVTAARGMHMRLMCDEITAVLALKFEVIYRMKAVGQ